MSTAAAYIGKGWSFPPEFDPVVKSVVIRQGTDDIDESLKILLSTVQGERIMQHTYGCDMNELLFEPVNVTLKTYMADKIKTAILYFEPRIDVENIDLKDDQINEGIVLIEIDYIVRTTNSRKNFVFPFYKTEGTEVQK
jgi:uncharacterized protein